MAAKQPTKQPAFKGGAPKPSGKTASSTSTNPPVGKLKGKPKS